MTDVLVVDDDRDVRESLAEALESLGYSVAQATNGRDALAQLRAHAPRLVLLDLMMPVMDGWQFRKEQLADRAIAEIPVVVLSAAAGFRASAATVPVPPADFLAKPIDLVRLRDAVQRHCPAPAPP